MGSRAIGFGLAGLLLAGCQPAPAPVAAAIAEPAPFEGVGYLALNAPIGPSSRDLFAADIDHFVSQGAREIRLGINSPGGDIDAAQAMVDHMRRVHDRDGVTFKAYNTGLVASAATYLFLNAQERYTAADGAFLFHAAGMVARGPVNAESLREQADRLDRYEGVVRATLKRRTRLTDGEAQIYLRRTVILSSDDARHDGVVDGIAQFALPKGARGWVISMKPPAAAPASQPAAAP